MTIFGHSYCQLSTSSDRWRWSKAGGWAPNHLVPWLALQSIFLDDCLDWIFKKRERHLCGLNRYTRSVYRTVHWLHSFKKRTWRHLGEDCHLKEEKNLTHLRSDLLCYGKNHLVIRCPWPSSVPKTSSRLTDILATVNLKIILPICDWLAVGIWFLFGSWEVRPAEWDRNAMMCDTSAAGRIMSSCNQNYKVNREACSTFVDRRKNGTNLPSGNYTGNRALNRTSQLVHFFLVFKLLKSHVSK